MRQPAAVAAIMRHRPPNRGSAAFGFRSSFSYWLVRQCRARFRAPQLPDLRLRQFGRLDRDMAAARLGRLARLDVDALGRLARHHVDGGVLPRRLPEPARRRAGGPPQPSQRDPHDAGDRRLAGKLVGDPRLYRRHHDRMAVCTDRVARHHKFLCAALAHGIDFEPRRSVRPCRPPWRSTRSCSTRRGSSVRRSLAS